MKIGETVTIRRLNQHLYEVTLEGDALKRVGATASTVLTIAAAVFADEAADSMQYVTPNTEKEA